MAVVSVSSQALPPRAMKLLLYTPEPAELRAIRHAARERLEGAQEYLDEWCGVWETRPFDPENAEAVSQAYDLLDDAIAVAGEWMVPGCPPLTARVGSH